MPARTFLGLSLSLSLSLSSQGKLNMLVYSKTILKLFPQALSLSLSLFSVQLLSMKCVVGVSSIHLTSENYFL